MGTEVQQIYTHNLDEVGESRVSEGEFPEVILNLLVIHTEPVGVVLCERGRDQGIPPIV